MLVLAESYGQRSCERQYIAFIYSIYKQHFSDFNIVPLPVLVKMFKNK